MKWLMARKKRPSPRDLIVSLLFIFQKHQREEVSLGEVHDSVAEVQKVIPLGFDFLPRFAFSPELSEEIEKLQASGLVEQVVYQHDSFLPKRFIRLTAYGKGRARKVTNDITQGDAALIEKAVISAIDSCKQRWTLWSR